jgi:hypothetical protein
MATLEQCRTALEQVGAAIASGRAGRKPPELDRSLSCRLKDLDDGLHARLAAGLLQDVEPGENRDAQIKITLTSDDLLALAAGELHFAKAWASGRVKVDASVRDILRLRSFL